jgi:hypothetical protein
MTFVQLIDSAKKCTYRPTNKPFDQYTDNEIIYSAIHEILKNDIIVFAFIIMCKKHMTIKIPMKIILKEYIELYS